MECNVQKYQNIAAIDVAPSLVNQLRVIQQTIT